MCLTESFIHLAPKHFWIPKEDGPEDPEQGGSKQHIVEVSHDEVGIVNVDVDRHSRHKDTAEAAHHKHRDKSYAVERDRVEFDFPTPDGADPVECLNR